MNNEQYIKALGKALSGLDKQSRDDILLEIQSHADELGEDNNSLLQHFGPPESLANEYLDGNKPSPGIGKKALGIGYKIVSIAGATLVALIALIALVLWLISGDKYNYANENAEQLAEYNDWREMVWREPLKIDVQQAHTVVYWHEENTLRWRCKGREIPEPTDEGHLSIRHGFCIVFLPRIPTSIRVEQGNIVLVRPQANLELNAEQSNIRFAENNAILKYEINTQHSDVEGFSSQDKADINIIISALESTIGHYTH